MRVVFFLFIYFSSWKIFWIVQLPAINPYIPQHLQQRPSHLSVIKNTTWAGKWLVINASEIIQTNSTFPNTTDLSETELILTERTDNSGKDFVVSVQDK